LYVQFDYLGQRVDLVKTATKVNAIVSGQTSVKAPERIAFENYLPADAQIISCHSLHGPGVNPMGQPLVGPFPLLSHHAIIKSEFIV
jgi:prephenate dehydrogenase (NADP+)